MPKRFEVGHNSITRNRPYDTETIPVPPDECEWAGTSRRRAEKLFLWHRNHGLERGTPHPMGKTFEAAEAA